MESQTIKKQCESIDETLVFAVGYTPTKVEYENAHYIGDCGKVGNLKDAISGAYQLAKSL